MFTSEKVLDVLTNIGVTKDQIEKWERYFGIDVPHDKYGRKFYTSDHIKVFKAIKKNVTLGYSLPEIRKKLNLGPVAVEKDPPQRKKEYNIKPASNPINKPITKSDSVSSNSEDNLYLIMLVERVMDEKDQLLRDKDYLLEQLHLLEMQKQEIKKASLEYIDQISEYTSQVEALEQQLQTNVAEIPAENFVGSWSGRAKLIKTIFDNIGIDIPKERNKSFKVTEPPKRHYGNMAVLMSSFKCEDDPLWERVETYRVAYLNDEELKGELDVEYFVDDVPVAKAIYTINCLRKGAVIES